MNIKSTGKLIAFIGAAAALAATLINDKKDKENLVENKCDEEDEIIL